LYEPRIAAPINVHAAAVDALESAHQQLADDLDFDLVGDSRPAALWQMSGRCIGLMRLMLDALAWGYCGEVQHLARELHEANRLLEAFADPHEAALLRKWLADEGNDWVRPAEARAALARGEERLAESMRAQGSPPLRKLTRLIRAMYAEQSQAAHHRRRWTQDEVLPDLRTMIRGRTNHWLRRAATTNAMLAVVEEGVQCVRDSLGRFYAGFYAEYVQPLIANIAAVRGTHPLP
jgi:hypothetical protein